MASTSAGTKDNHYSINNDDEIASFSDDGSHPQTSSSPTVLVYHKSARSIVFRDHLRRAALGDEKKPRSRSNSPNVHPPRADSPQQQPRLDPLPSLDFGPENEFAALLEAPVGVATSEAELQVVSWLETEQAVVKTVKNTDWGPFLQRFTEYRPSSTRILPMHRDRPRNESKDLAYCSFHTSVSLLPSGGRRMRCYGSVSQYTVGVIFRYPPHATPQALASTETWSWPAGYSAKTEFNIDGRGQLINGRRQAIVPVPQLRQYNDEYLHADSYTVGGRKVQNFKEIPYNEIYLRVGGVDNSKPASLQDGVGIPVALFCRTAKFGHLIALLRTRARLNHTLGEARVKGIPLLLINPERGVQVLTEELQKDLWRIAAQKLNPFQNSAFAHRTTVQHTDETSFQQKVDELLDLDDSIQELLTPEELAHVAGGFGATDDSVAILLKKAMDRDREINKKQSNLEKSHLLQDVVNAGLSSALRSGDYHTSRQLLILYSLVASRNCMDNDDQSEEKKTEKPLLLRADSNGGSRSSLGRDVEYMKKDFDMVARAKPGTVANKLPSPPPPPPLDTDRLRSATNSDGLLAVLGAAQVLRVMQDGSAKLRVEETVDAVNEWVDHGQESVTFRISSWYDQRAAQGDLKIAMENNSSFMAFVSNKAIANRKAFAHQLRAAVAVTDFNDIRFLEAINQLLSKMHSPCLRLELLQYVLGLDNRFSAAHVARSVELAMTCLDLSAPVNDSATSGAQI